MRQEEKVDQLAIWIKEAGTESPEEGFHLTVMQKIEALPKVNYTYEPVISPLAWKLIIGLITSIFLGSIVLVPTDQTTPSLFDKFPSPRFPSFRLDWINLSFPSLDISLPFLTGIIAFFILGFFMILGTMRNKQAGV